MACRFGLCEINNNRPKSKSPKPKSAEKPKKTAKIRAAQPSSSDWSDSEESCSGCSACWGSSSSCSCSECNMETDSSDDACYLGACGPKPKKSAAEKPAGKNKKVLQCKDGVCAWVPKKKAKKAAKPKESARTNGKVKKSKTPKNCYECR